MSKLSKIKTLKTRAVNDYWTPAQTPTILPAPFDPDFLYGSVALSNSDYTLTGSGGFAFTGQILPHDATLRGHVVTLDITNILDTEALYIGSINADEVSGATDSHLFLLVWNAGNNNFDVMGGNPISDAPVPLGSMSYTNGQELSFGTSWDGVDGYLALYLDGVFQYDLNPAVPMTDATVSFGCYHATASSIISNIIQTPAFPVMAITQYTSTVLGPVVYPTNPAGKIFEVEGVAPGGIVVDGFVLKNGMWAEFDQNENLVSPIEPEVPFLTEPAADLLYSPLVTHFYNQITSPSISDDSSSIGAMVGSKWQDSFATPDEWYICSDPSPGAAVWIKLSVTVDELGSMALQTAGSGPTEYRDNAAQDLILTAYVQGPVSSTDNFLPLFDSISGKLLKESTLSFTAGVLSDTNNLTVQSSTAGLTLSGVIVDIDCSGGFLTLDSTNQIAFEFGATDRTIVFSETAGDTIITSQYDTVINVGVGGATLDINTTSTMTLNSGGHLNLYSNGNINFEFGAFGQTLTVVDTGIVSRLTTVQDTEIYSTDNLQLIADGSVTLTADYGVSNISLTLSSTGINTSTPLTLSILSGSGALNVNAGSVSIDSNTTIEFEFGTNNQTLLLSDIATVTTLASSQDMAINVTGDLELYSTTSLTLDTQGGMTFEFGSNNRTITITDVLNETIFASNQKFKLDVTGALNILSSDVIDITGGTNKDITITSNGTGDISLLSDDKVILAAGAGAQVTIEDITAVTTLTFLQTTEIVAPNTFTVNSGSDITLDSSSDVVLEFGGTNNTVTFSEYASITKITMAESTDIDVTGILNINSTTDSVNVTAANNYDVVLTSTGNGVTRVNSENRVSCEIGTNSQTIEFYESGSQSYIESSQDLILNVVSTDEISLGLQTASMNSGSPTDLAIASKKYVDDATTYRAKKYAFVYTETPSFVIGVLPTNSVILGVTVKVNTTFDGTPTLTVGNSTTNNGAMLSGDNDLTTLGVYTKRTYFDVASDTTVRGYLTSTAPTQGAAVVIIEYYCDV